jgi:hypothetical protein
MFQPNAFSHNDHHVVNGCVIYDRPTSDDCSTHDYSVYDCPIHDYSAYDCPTHDCGIRCTCWCDRPLQRRDVFL